MKPFVVICVCAFVYVWTDVSARNEIDEDDAAKHFAFHGSALLEERFDFGQELEGGVVDGFEIIECGVYVLRFTPAQEDRLGVGVSRAGVKLAIRDLLPEIRILSTATSKSDGSNATSSMRFEIDHDLAQVCLI